LLPEQKFISTLLSDILTILGIIYGRATYFWIVFTIRHELKKIYVKTSLYIPLRVSLMISGVATIDTATHLRAQTHQQKNNVTRPVIVSGQEYLQTNGDGTSCVHLSVFLRFEIYFATSGLQSHFASCCTDYTNVE
jgi:hypothetical protein